MAKKSSSKSAQPPPIPTPRPAAPTESIAKKSRKSAQPPPLPPPRPAASTESDTESDEQTDEVEVRPPRASKSKSLSAFQGSDGDDSDGKSDEVEGSPPAPKSNTSLASEARIVDNDGDELDEDDADAETTLRKKPKKLSSMTPSSSKKLRAQRQTSPKSTPARSTKVWSDQDLHALFSWLETHLQKTSAYPIQKDYEAAGGASVLFSDSTLTWSQVYEKMRRLRSTFWGNYLKGKLPVDPHGVKVYKLSKKIWGPKTHSTAENSTKSKHSRWLEVEGGVGKKQKTVIPTVSNSGIDLLKTEVHFPHLRHAVDEISRGESWGMSMTKAFDGVDREKASVLEQKFIKLRRDQLKMKTREFELYKKITELVWAVM